MIKIENLNVYGMKDAIRGMRNPMNSWDKSDSIFQELSQGYVYKIGENDRRLMYNLIKGGTEHRKFLRQIWVCMDITAPLYWWKEFDTYKVGTTANSCSTMHKIHDRPLTLEDFSFEHLYSDELEVLKIVIATINGDRELYLDGRHKNDWWQMIQLLPSSYNQRRTVTMNYEVCMNICMQREGHKLDEWHDFIATMKSGLPELSNFVEVAKGEKEVD